MENKNYICPLNPKFDEGVYCVKGICAWWDEDAQACALLTLARSVRKVTRNGR